MTRPTCYTCEHCHQDSERSDGELLPRLVCLRYPPTPERQLVDRCLEAVGWAACGRVPVVNPDRPACGEYKPIGGEDRSEGAWSATGFYL